MRSGSVRAGATIRGTRLNPRRIATSPEAKASRVMFSPKGCAERAHWGAGYKQNFRRHTSNSRQRPGKMFQIPHPCGKGWPDAPESSALVGADQLGLLNDIGLCRRQHVRCGRRRCQIERCPAGSRTVGSDNDGFHASLAGKGHHNRVRQNRFVLRESRCPRRFGP